MKLGLIVRANNRGLGTQTWEIWRHLHPEVTVVIDALPDRPKWQFYPERFPGAIITEWAGYTAPISIEAEEALLTCDVIFSVETPYSQTLFERARHRGVQTVLYVNPELHRLEESRQASAVWVPTKWRIEHIPRAELVPMPVALDRFQDHVPGDRYLFLGGHTAKGSRNGEEIAIRAARFAGIDLTVTSQDRPIVNDQHLVYQAGHDDYWRMYDGHGVLVFPRKYGGLCLPVQEAMAAGLAVVMSDTSPNQDWPVSLVSCTKTKPIRLPGGTIDVFESDRMQVAAEMTRLLDEDYRGERQEASRAWARQNSWDALLPEWIARLEGLCD